MESDRKGDLSGALQNYQKAVENFMIFVREERDERISDRIRLSIDGYLKRAEYLKGKIDVLAGYDEGVALLNEAIEAESKNDYQRAYQLYTTAIELILKYTQFEQNSSHHRIYKQIETYLDRAEILKQKISRQTEQTPKLPLSSEINQVMNQNSSEGLCVVCLSYPATYAMIPCGHLILCENCLPQSSDNHQMRICYFCREELIPPKYLRVFTT